MLTGVPGAGKTALLIEMLMDEIRKGRKIFTQGVPELLLKTHSCPDPQTWHQGTWLKIDRYDPELAKKLGLSRQWIPRGCPIECHNISWCEGKMHRYKERKRVSDELQDDLPECNRDMVKFNDNDYGALVIFDESHAYFPQRPSGKQPPPHVEALSVHRHQGLDIMFISQRPNFLDSYVRDLVTQHIHLGFNLFAFLGHRIKYVWSEYQSTVSRTTKMQAQSSKYRPNPLVFPLYQSATVHTKLDHAMPNILKFFILALAILVCIAVFAVYRVQNRIETLKNPTPVVVAPSVSAPSAPLDSGGGGERSAPPDSVAGGAFLSASVPRSPYPRVDSCVANDSACRCFLNGSRVPMELDTCRAIISGGWISSDKPSMPFPDRTL